MADRLSPDGAPRRPVRVAPRARRSRVAPARGASVAEAAFGAAPATGAVPLPSPWPTSAEPRSVAPMAATTRAVMAMTAAMPVSGLNPPIDFLCVACIFRCSLRVRRRVSTWEHRIGARPPGHRARGHRRWAGYLNLRGLAHGPALGSNGISPGRAVRRAGTARSAGDGAGADATADRRSPGGAPRRPVRVVSRARR